MAGFDNKSMHADRSRKMFKKFLERQLGLKRMLKIRIKLNVLSRKGENAINFF